MIKRNLLIVEDDPIILKDLLTWTTEAGHSITGICSNGEDTLNQVKSNKPDLVILDLDIKDGTGYEIAERIKESVLPFIVVTGSTNEELHRRILRMKASGLMVKSIHREKFERVLNNSLRNIAI